MKKYREKLLTIRKYACKRCSSKFFNNIKLHQHMQNYHQKKFVTKLAKSIFNELVLSIASNTFSQLFSKSFIISSFILSSTFFIIYNVICNISRNIKETNILSKIISKFILSKSSRLSFSMFEFLKNASISFFTFLLIFSLSTRFYITMNNLFVIFNEKSKSLNLSHCQKNQFLLYC